MDREVRRVSWWQQPVWLALVGLALMVGGWKLSTYVPVPPELAKLRRLAGKSELGERLAQIGQPPYQLPGRLVFFAGLLLFVVSVVQMYRQPPAVRNPEEQQSEPDEPMSSNETDA